MKEGHRASGSAIAIALLLFFTAAACLLAGCAAAPPRADTAPEAPLPPSPKPPQVVRPPVPGPPSGPAAVAGRPIRVLLSGAQKEITVQGGPVRAWSSAGALLSEEGRAVRLAAHGDRIRWGQEKTFDSPIDVASPSGLLVGGKRIAARARIHARQGQLMAVAVVPLEEYVAAVTSREAPPSFLPEALSALAVAVRTYALLSAETPRDPTHDLVASVEDQVFEGLDNVAAVFREAAGRTRGEVLVYRGGLARASYHSTCGGRTETAKDAWGKDVPYLRAVACDDCAGSPARRWDYRMVLQEGKRVALSMGVRAEGDLKIEITGWSSTGRASRVRLSSRGVSRDATAAAFRRAAGYSRIKSLRMEVVHVGNGWVFTGHGYGHGVGMCQWGGNGMAKAGRTYREILARYYPETGVAKGGP